MAFSFGNSAPAAASVGPNVQTGSDLPVIQTENIYFRALSGSAKIQLIPTAWPADQLPPPTSSLMSIASQRGLVAAAGPDTVILATTESVRKAFEGPDGGDVKPFEPQLRIQMSMRLSQVAFTADEQYLVLSAETGGGLAVYEVQTLLQGNTNSAFQISTEQLSLRALVPNPTPEKGELIALVTIDGKLMMANLKEKKIMAGPNGSVLKDGVSCVSWSAKGKQLVAGLGDGTAYQMTPEGEGKAVIPFPPGGNGGDHVSSITWLENHVFLVVYTPSQYDTSVAPQSTFNIVTRQQQQPSNFMFQKIADPAGPFGLNRSPPHHFLLRLRDFPPNLQDLILVASSASADIGLFSRSKVPLTSDKPADQITGVFTLTEMSDDSRRAALPMTAELSDTSPIGFAMDLSSKETVEKPIPGDEMNESPTPVPALMVLNNEGVLAAWWVIYLDSIRQGTAFPGLVAAGGSQTTATIPKSTQSTAPAPAFASPAQPSFGSSPFGGSPSTSIAFGAPRPTAAFGSPALSVPSTSAFGAPSGLGNKQSPWGASATPAAVSSGPAFGSSTFGTSPAAPAGSSGPAFGSTAFGATSAAPNQSFGTPSFGATSVPSLGNRASPWATGGSTAPAAAFGQPGGLTTQASPFGTPANVGNAPASSGFAAFATKGGFGSNAAAAASGGSIFGTSAQTPNPFSSAATSTAFGAPPATTSTPFGAPAATTSTSFAATPVSKNTLFGGAPATESKNIFGGGFSLKSSFEADPSAKDDDSEPPGQSGGLFGSNFDSALGEAANQSTAETPVSKEADMDADDSPRKDGPAIFSSTTPISTPAPPKTSLFGTSAPAGSNVFGSPSDQPPKAGSAGFVFDPSSSDNPKPSPFSTFSNLNKDISPGPKTPTLIESQTQAPFPKTPSSPKVKPEPDSDSEEIPEAPLPPDTTSKSSYAAGQSSGSSVTNDAPLPPDFLSTKRKQTSPAPALALPVLNPIRADLIPPSDVPGGPDEGSDSGFLTEEEGEVSEEASEELSEEGSGEDVAKDLSPTSENNQTPAFSPESSIGGTKTRNQEANVFTKINKPDQSSQTRSLFGEVNRNAPILPPPKMQNSPRSPSPLRSAIPGRLHRPEAPRSSSAPGFASELLGSRRLGVRPNGPAQDTLKQTQEEMQAEHRRRQAAKSRQEAEESQTLELDAEDAKFQAEVHAPVVPSRKLEDFATHTDYDGNSTMENVPAQIEAVFRDINRMIDTLGWNSRSLKCFILAHEDQYKDEGRGREDLEESDDWCLSEIERLSRLVEENLGQDLEAARVKDAKTKLEACESLQRDLNRLRAKSQEVKKALNSLLDPDTVAIARAQPLSADQAIQQTDLRRDFTKFQRLLSEAEEGLSVLKAKLVSHASYNGRDGGSAGPTVEAVMRTITKMTGMAEKRSGDIDVLEGQMRRLRFGSVGGSREGSPFATPTNNRASVRNLGASSLFHTPESVKDSHSRFQNSLMSSVGSRGRGSPPKKKLSGYSAEEKMILRAQVARKKDVTDKLKAALLKNGTKVRKMTDGDDDE
ncbi:uncharacterized protein L3040_008975 [Drepanopeziza brunnea f. sp. 'multigermtubi']|uniref:Nucleoporin Nup159/Nup146 N-terminal domain-containing protein n=1 Tax=Marssonina brunnea f. sp. multigermtubi (strain MB_m1) TaxID=1072389 RepID=K1WXP5_MARBU|nr:uncharacterized protein MBM_04904 [Drepanopeziza brunnea f. sp. 'multigermtubi' MB_m1]EKD17327.1 hypothetical protein MBM_04904 [Drepanopeziza brunnea f. sp. 'multigermtubi' MB_m1]KAJ5032370.1 hypothetical protein L3040_008975 [Drepanopeziza brunnea f. sp. 'multigermtubi']